MAEKVKRTNPFTPWPHVVKGQTDFDKTYKSIEILDKVVKVGEGDEDFIIEKYVKVTERPIQEVIDADKDSVGVDNILRQVLRSGDMDLLPVDKGECNVDLVGAPESLMDVKQLGQDAEASFGKLPKELTNDLDMTAFVNGMSQEKFDAFIKAVEERNKKEVKKDGE